MEEASKGCEERAGVERGWEDRWEETVGGGYKGGGVVGGFFFFKQKTAYEIHQ